MKPRKSLDQKKKATVNPKDPQKLRREKLHRELAEGYVANASQARGMADDFSHIDSSDLTP